MGEDGKATGAGAEAAGTAVVPTGGVLLQAATATTLMKPSGRHKALKALETEKTEKAVGAFRRMPGKKTLWAHA
jgi:hypothetical protein